MNTDATNQPWFLLYGGSSEDGLGPGIYIGRTTDEAVARKHAEECSKNPYSTGYVNVVTDDKILRLPNYKGGLS